MSDLDEGWELDARELHLLDRACRCADDMALLEIVIAKDGVTTVGSRNQVVVHPALQEVRQLRLVQLRLLGALEIADPASLAGKTAAQQQGRRAVQARWAGRAVDSRG